MAKVTNNIPAIIKSLKRYAKSKNAKLREGVNLAALYLLRESQKLVPVDYGNLKASGTVQLVTAPGDKKQRAHVVYTAKYAVYVHEDLTKAHGKFFNLKYAAELAHAKSLRRKKKGGTKGPFRHNRGENQQAKFLEMPFRRDQAIVKAIVRNTVMS